MMEARFQCDRGLPLFSYNARGESVLVLAHPEPSGAEEPLLSVLPYPMQAQSPFPLHLRVS